MKLIDVTWQSRNDFTGILECEHCGSHQSALYCYDDDRFHTKVIPSIKCLLCNKRGVDEIPSGISDPEFQGGSLVVRKSIVIERWMLKDE